MNNLLNDKLFRSSDVSVAVYDLTDDKMLFEHRAQKMVRPASVMKVVTSVTALEHLGADYKIDTDMRRRHFIYISAIIHLSGRIGNRYERKESYVRISSRRTPRKGNGPDRADDAPHHAHALRRAGVFGL